MGIRKLDSIFNPKRIAIVGVTINPNSVGRLIADQDHETVEYAVLIIDAWQKKELGSMLTDYCMEIAGTWNLKRMVAQTTTDNRPMISVFEKRGFSIRFDNQDATVGAVKDLAEKQA